MLPLGDLSNLGNTSNNHLPSTTSGEQYAFWLREADCFSDSVFRKIRNGARIN